MAQIGVLAANAETVLNIQFLPEFLVFDNVANDDNFLVESIIAGKSRIVGTNGTLNKALNKVGNAGIGVADGVLPKAGNVQPLANGGKGNETVQLRITNPTITAVNIYGTSTGKNDGTCITRSTSQVDPNSNQEFKFFDKLAFLIANVASVQIEWKNGWSDRYSVEELNAVLCKMTPYFQRPDGLVAGVVVVDNTADIFKSVRIYSTDNSVQVMREGTELI